MCILSTIFVFVLEICIPFGLIPKADFNFFTEINIDEGKAQHVHFKIILFSMLS